MLFNKYTYRKTNDKKLLHKIGKRWVTVSIAMLALLGGSFAMKSVTTHADTTTPAVKAQQTNNIKTQLNRGLDQAYSAGVQKQSAQATNSVGPSSARSVASSSAPSSAIKPSAVQSQATNMYRGLMANAVTNQNKQSESTTTESSANSNISNQGSSKVASSSATNSDSNASTPNYIEDHAHYNLGSYNARQSQSTEAQKEAYANYLKQNPQLAHAYNETANQSGSNNVANSNVASNAPKNSVSASSITSNSSASSVSANNSKVSSANQISDKKNKPLMKLGLTSQLKSPNNDTDIPPFENNNIIASGNIVAPSTAKWSLDKNGVLLIHDGKFGAISYDNYTDGAQNNFAPYINNNNTALNKIKYIEFKNTTLPGSFNFSGVPNLKIIDFSGINPSMPILPSESKGYAPTAWDTVFSGDSNLVTINFGHNLNTSHITGNTGTLFGNDSSLKNLIGFSDLDLHNLTDVNDCFQNDTSLQSLDLSNFDTAAARANNHAGNGGNGISNLIVGCKNLQNLKLGPKTILTNQAINGDESLSNAFNPNTHSIIDIADGHAHPGTMTLLQGSQDSGTWNTAHYVLGNNGALLIYNGTIDSNHNDAKKGNNVLDWSKVSHIYTSNITAPSNMNSTFANLPNLQSVDLTDLDTSQTTNMDSLFNGDNNLKSIDMNLGQHTTFDKSFLPNSNYTLINPSTKQVANNDTFGDGNTYQGIWTNNAEIINVQYNGNNVAQGVIQEPINSVDTISDAPLVIPSRYNLDNPSQSFTINGGTINVSAHLASVDSAKASEAESQAIASAANSAASSAEAKDDGTITADSTALNNDINAINSLTNNNTKLSQEVSYANSGASNADALDSAIINVLSNGSYKNSGLNTNDTALLNSVVVKYKDWNKASAKADTNSTAISQIQTKLASYNTISSDASSAMRSLNNDSAELSWLSNSESALSTGSSQASSNASWIKANSANVSTLSSGWTSIENKITNAKSTLQDAINTKASNDSLTADYHTLSDDIKTASGLASDAKKLANTNSSEIGNLKSNTAITFSFSQDGNSNVQIPITMTNGYIIKNAASDEGNNTYNITNLLNSAVSSKGKHVVGKYTVTLGTDNKGDATITYNAPQTAPKHQSTLGMSAPSTNDDMNTFTLGTPDQQRKAWNYVQYGINHPKGLILGASKPSRVPASTDTAHNVVLANNQAEYKGKITLNFGSGKNAKSTTLTFDTGSDNPKVLASDTVNLLNYAKNAQNPSDFTKDNLINGFDTTGFKFINESATKDGKLINSNNPYSFTIQPSDATNQSGADPHTFDITLNYSAQPVTENIQYVYGSHIENIDKTTTTTTGNDDSQGNWKDTTNLKSGWQLSNATNNPFTFTNNGTAKVKVSPVQTTDTINYVDQKGNNVGSQTFTGNNYQATDAGNNGFNIDNTTDTKLDKNYKLKTSSTPFKYDGGTYTVNVIGNARSPKNTVPSSTKPSDANNPKSNKSMTKPTGDSDVLFTINVNDYNADGTKEINHYTKYTTESGKVGDPFTIKASDYLTNGFNIEPSKSKDSDVCGTIGDNQLQPNSVTFNYYAKASTFDPNKAKTDPNYVKHYNSDPTTPKPISVQYIGESNGEANQVVETYSNVITGNTGDTGTLSNIESVTKVPKGYTVRGNNYNYTITTAPQTIKVYLNSETAKQMNNGGQNYKPTTPSDKPSSKVPSDNTVKKDASHGFATVIINEDINGKLAHQSAQTVDESNLGVGDGYTIEPTSFTPKGYQVDSKDQALTGTVNPDGSLSNGSTTFTYDVNSSEIAPIQITYYNQYGDLINKNTGKSKLTGDNDVTNSDATVTITSAQLATKGAIGDTVDITGFLTAPKGHHFKGNIKKITDSNGKPLNHVQLQKANNSKPLHLGLMLFMAMPKPTHHVQPNKPNSSTNKPNSSASAKSNTSNSSVPSSSSNVAPSNSTNPFTPIMPNVIPNPSASASNTESSATSQSVAPSSVASAKYSRSAKPSSAEKHVNHTTKINHKRSVATKHSVKSVVSGKAKHARNITTTKAATSLNNMNHQVATKGATHQTTNAKSINESINNSSASVVSGVATNSNATKSEPITNVANNDNEATINNSVSPESTAESNVTMPSANAESDKQNTITNNNNDNRKKLPQTNEASSHSLLVAIVALLAGLSLMGVDLYRKHNN